MTKTLLFTGGGGVGNEALYRLLGDRYRCLFADADIHAISSVIPPEHRRAIPFARDAGFVDAIAALCQADGVDFLVPGVDEELVKLAEARAVLAPTQVMLAAAGFVALMLDKLEAARAIRARGLSAPLTVPITEADQLDFPLIAKPRSGRGSRGVQLLAKPAQVPAYLTLADQPADLFCAQEYAVGQEYTVFGFGDPEGRLQAIAPVKVHSKKGVTIRAVTDRDPAIIAYLEAFHAAFQPAGPYNVQCVLTPNGRVLPFEVNPRVSTTFCLSIAAGYDAFSPPLGGLFVPRPGVSLNREWRNLFAGA